MKRLTLLTSLTLALAIPLQADDARHQTYISYDDGGTLVRPADDDREMEARVNLPIFPGDEVITNRRGRTELRLADGNILALDRATAIRLVSALDSYEGDSEETIVELRYGKVAVYRVRDAREHLRLDTPGATYFASSEAIFSVETDSRGRDRVTVLDGVIEVRTPARSTRLRRGESAEVDNRGMYDLTSSADASDDFERWFLGRSERYGREESRYLDRSLAYYEDELSSHGSWIHTSHYGWAWRPSVAVGWRPYHNGYWSRSRYGCLNWVSYEPWGWVPYHYGRWSHDPYHGWFWVPGIGYAPAWVYWWYGNGYLGWAPAGWWDLHRPYYNWAYRPYHNRGLTFGAGFYGRVRINDIDLRPWTFIDSNTIVSNRVDRAALTTDAIRARLQRDNGGFATVSSDPARFTREEFRDPAAAINRRWEGVDTGRAGAGAAVTPVDVTPFIRRDAELPDAVRDRVVRNRPSDGSRAPQPAVISGGGSSGGLAPIRGGGVAPIGRGGLAPIGGGGLAPVGGSSGSTGQRVTRGGNTPAPPRQDAPAVRTPDTPSEGGAWRGRVVRPSGGETQRESRSRTTTPATGTRVTSPPSRDVPARVIDRIGGARVQSGERSRATRESGSSSTPPKVDRPSSSPPPRASSGGSKPSSSGGSKSGGSDSGRIKRDQ
ncbi:MAG TPA: DUF6600 domain-containing protein [Thermoanaerobaculia bacterium]|nr:DUF6600 domain-containing protein [Thermoanaerobaculia bacterium]